MTTSRRGLTLTEQELLFRLRWSVRFRWFAGCATVVALLVAWYKFDVRFPVANTVIVAMAVPFYNAVFALFLSNLTTGESMSIRRMMTLANAQVVCDIVAVVALIHLTGGVENPFAVFLTVPIVYSLPLLTRRIVFWHATLAAVLLNVVFWGECFGILDHICLPTVGEDLLHQNRLFVFQVSFAYTVTLYLLLFIGGSVAGTLRKRERELENAHRQLKELHQAHTFYVRKVSHELRAPLAAIRSLLRVILQGLAGALGEKQRSMMERVDARAEGLLELVAELLTFSRLEAIEVLQDDEIINMSELVGRIARLFQPMAQGKNLQMTVSVVPFSVKGNREDLRELVTNLISNAIRYTPLGGRIFVLGLVHQCCAALSVTDTGIGIPVDKIPRVFDEFFRASNAKQAVPEGTGMGLAITKRIAEMHGGHIEVKSIEGKGTTFTVSLPLFRSEFEPKQRFR